DGHGTAAGVGLGRPVLLHHLEGGGGAGAEVADEVGHGHLGPLGRGVAVEGPALGTGHEAEQDPVRGVGGRIVEGDPQGAVVGDDLAVQAVVAPEGAVVDGV